MEFNRTNIFICFVLPVLLFVGWFFMPLLGHIYYTNAKGVRDPIITDDNFDFTTEGFSKTYPYSNKYLIPARAYVKLTKVNKLLPKDPTRGAVVKVNFKVLVEIIHRGEVISELMYEKPIPVSYSISRRGRYRFLGIHEIPISYLAKFYDDVKLRLTIVETDPVLFGCQGTLIIKPRLSH